MSDNNNGPPGGSGKNVQIPHAGDGGNPGAHNGQNGNHNNDGNPQVNNHDGGGGDGDDGDIMFEVDLPIDSPVDPFLNDRGDDNVIVPDEDPRHSIYELLNATAHPYTGPLRADVAAVVEDIYPSPATDPHGFYAELRQLDPQRQHYRHLDLLASAAASAPHEREVNALVHYWNARVPLPEPPAGGQPFEPPLQHLVSTAYFYRWWLHLLYQPVLFPMTQPIDYEASTARLRMLARVTDGIQDLRHAETAMGRAALEHLRQHPPPAETAWVDSFLRSVGDAYAHTARLFRQRGGGAAGLAVADAAYRALSVERRVCIQLLATEKLVERVLARRHVEDMHLSRRVRAFEHDDVARIPFSQAYALREAVTHALELEVRQIQHVANRTAAYRFFRRMTCLRPWRRLYLIFGDDDDYAAAAAAAARNGGGDGGGDGGGGGGGGGGNAGAGNGAGAGAARPNPLAAPVGVVRNILRRLNLIELDKKRGLQPLLLRPLPLRDLGADKICVVCQEGYAPEQVMLRTACNHDFHMHCIFKQWDSESWKRFQCALCRSQASAPGAILGVEPPSDEVSLGDVRWLRQEYRQLLQWQDENPGVPLSPAQKATRMAYWRRFTHNRDKRSIIGFGGRAYDWHPLPLLQMYEEEDLPTPPHPRYVYDVDLDRLVPEDPAQSPPMFRLRLRANEDPPPNMGN
jgi:uncharacterized membrane protein YgcG